MYQKVKAIFMRKISTWPKKYLPDNPYNINNPFQDNYLKPFKKLCFRSLRGAERRGNLIDFSRYWRLLHFVRNDDIGIFQRSFLNQHNFTKGNIVNQVWLRGV